MTDPTLAFVDTETTGLDPVRHEVWEVGLILRRPQVADEEFLWQLPVDLPAADLIALNIGRFNERRWPLPRSDDRGSAESALAGRLYATRGPGKRVLPMQMEAWAHQFMTLTWGAHLVGAVPDFDSRRLGDLLLRHGAIPAWHYHLVDVETLAAGFLTGKHRGQSPEGPLGDRAVSARPPWRSDDLAAALGVDVPGEARHTALGDARMARAVYDAVYEGEQ